MLQEVSLIGRESNPSTSPFVEYPPETTFLPPSQAITSSRPDLGFSESVACLTDTSPAALLAGPGVWAARWRSAAADWPSSFLALSATLALSALSARFARGRPPAATAVPLSEMKSARRATTRAGLGRFRTVISCSFHGVRSRRRHSLRLGTPRRRRGSARSRASARRRRSDGQCAARAHARRLPSHGAHRRLIRRDWHGSCEVLQRERWRSACSVRSRSGAETGSSPCPDASSERYSLRWRCVPARSSRPTG